MKYLPIFVVVIFVVFLYTDGSAQSVPVADSFQIHGGGAWVPAGANDQNPTTPNIVQQASHGQVVAVTGIDHLYVSSPGYTGSDSYIYGYCGTTPPDQCSNITVVQLWVVADDSENLGGSCPIVPPWAMAPSPSVGQPVNITNGNMWLRQMDYALPGTGENIEIERFYNSMGQTGGLFGLGWSTKYDEYLNVYDDRMLKFSGADGKGIYFGRTGATGPFKSVTPGYFDQIAKNTDGTYTLIFKDGRANKFSSAGKLLWQKDPNGNQITLGYNTGGSLVSVTDSFGRVLTLTPNANGTIQQIGDSLGTVATYEYFPVTNLLKTVIYPDGSTYKFEYTTIGGKTYLTTVKDALDNVLETHQYDAEGRATTSEKHGGIEKYSFDYSHANDTGITDALGRVTRYYFDKGKGKNVITNVEGLCGCGGGGSEVSTFEYDTNLNLVKKIDALLNETTFTYDSTGNPLTAHDILGTETYTYNSLGEPLTRTDKMGGVTTSTYNAAGNLLTSKDALNNITTLTYTSLGQLETVKDALNHITALTYDSQGRLTQVKDANNKTTNLAYDARARLTSKTNALSQTTAFEYDLNNRVKKVIYPDTNFVTYTYDAAGRRTASIDERNNTTTYGYDNAYRLTSVTDALNHTRSFGYDPMSNLTSRTDALGNVTNFEYDDFNRLKKTVYPASSAGATRLEERFEYDKTGKIKKRTDSANRETFYDYDPAYRLIKTTDAMGEITQFEYNARSQTTRVTDAIGQAYDFTYDALGRRLSQTRAGTTEAFEYDAVGNTAKRTDYMGRETTYEYDALNRLKKRNYLNGSGNPTPVNTAVYNYDDLSRLTSAVNEAGTVSLTYDTRGRLKTVTDVFGHVVDYGYDAAGNRNLLKLDGAGYAAYATDTVNRLTGITNVSDGTAISYSYDIADRLTLRTYPNGVNTTYEYDGMSRLTRLKDFSLTATLFDRQISFNTANQISQIVEPGTTRSFGYDQTDRLTAVTNPVSRNEAYAYDGVGNRSSSHRSTTYNYQPFNRVSATQTATYSYDADGSMTLKSEGPNLWRYTWDHENRMLSASNRKQMVRYRYDALGRRVLRYIPGGKENTKFIYDGADVLADDNSGTLTKYMNGPGADNKLRMQTGSTVSYFLADHLGSTNALVNSSGSITSQASYDAFGNQTGTLNTRYGFTGRERDDFTGQIYYRARFYDPSLGRFISEDPIGFGGGDVNLYGYVGNNSIRYRDPSGKIIPLLAAGIVIGAVSLILTSPAYVNAPAPGDPVYTPQDNVVANAVMGFAGGRILGWCGSKIMGRLGPMLFRGAAPEVASGVEAVAGEVADDVVGLADDVGASFKPYTRPNFRDNLSELTGETPVGSHAHHVFPVKYAGAFAKAGINIHEPRFGAWWNAQSHWGNGLRYNNAWEDVFSLPGDLTRQQLLQHGRDIMGSFGMSVNY